MTAELSGKIDVSNQLLMLKMVHVDIRTPRGELVQIIARGAIHGLICSTCTICV